MGSCTCITCCSCLAFKHSASELCIPVCCISSTKHAKDEKQGPTSCCRLVHDKLAQAL